MSKRAKFQVFEKALNGGARPDSLADYVELDAASPIPRLKFRNDALLNAPPEDYDVDHAFFDQLRMIREAQYRGAASFAGERGIKLIVAEGDSWFSMPMTMRPNTIADAIMWDPRFLVKNIAYWGHTLSTILRQKQYMTTLRNLRPDFFILSAGGNDLQQGLAAERSYVHRYDPTRDNEAYLTSEGQAGVDRMGKEYDAILREVTGEFSDLRILCHGYDYPRPLVGDGAYIGQHMRKLGIPDNQMEAIINPIVRLLNTTIETVASKYPKVKYLNLLGAAANSRWLDDMHPDREGFRALARIFMRAMSEWPP